MHVLSPDLENYGTSFRAPTSLAFVTLALEEIHQNLSRQITAHLQSFIIAIVRVEDELYLGKVVNGLTVGHGGRVGAKREKTIVAQ